MVGRSPKCEIRVEDEYASPEHCRIEQDDDGRVWVMDLGSTNGTRVLPAGVDPGANHMSVLLRSVPVPLGTRRRIVPGDTVIVGRTKIPWTAQ